MKALALLSGCLDSTLAIKVVQEAVLEVEAINFTSPFCRCSGASGGCGAATNAAKKLNVTLHYHPCGEDYLRIVEKPPHGYGKHLNPCLDCRIHKFKIAKVKIDEIGASFLFTGEVLDQRPNSQRRDALDIVERDSGLRGYILRPLCAKHLRPTIPEEKGWIDRNKLLDIKGRGRTQQINLAEEYGIQDYPCPAGGCLLTNEEYSLKVKDLLDHDGKLSMHSINLLGFGRHLRLSPDAKIIIGKDQVENAAIQRASLPENLILELADYAGPITLYLGTPEEPLINLAAAMTAGYGNVPDNEDIKVRTRGAITREILVKPMSREEMRKYFIYKV